MGILYETIKHKKLSEILHKLTSEKTNREDIPGWDKPVSNSTDTTSVVNDTLEKLIYKAFEKDEALDKQKEDKDMFVVKDIDEMSKKEATETVVTTAASVEPKKDDKVRMAPPWISYVSKLRVLFGSDPEIKIEYNDDEKEVKIFVEGNANKYEAMEKLLPIKKEFGNVTLYIAIIPSNLGSEESNGIQLVADLFSGNPIFDQIVVAPQIFNNPIAYASFKKEVVQYYDDNMADPNGNRSTLYQNIAEEVLLDPENDRQLLNGVYFCTQLVSAPNCMKCH